MFSNKKNRYRIESARRVFRTSFTTKHTQSKILLLKPESIKLFLWLLFIVTFSILLKICSMGFVLFMMFNLYVLRMLDYCYIVCGIIVTLCVERF